MLALHPTSGMGDGRPAMFGGGVLLKGCLGVLLAVLCAPVAVSYALAVMQGQAVNAPWCCATDV